MISWARAIRGLRRMRGSGQVPFLLVERARSECAPSTAAVGSTRVPFQEGEASELGRSVRGQARWSPVPVQRAVSEDPRWTRAVKASLATSLGEGCGTEGLEEWWPARLTC